MSEQQWYCPNCGPEISVTVERIHTFSGPDDYIVCTGCGETVDEKAETPAFVLALQQRIATLEAANEPDDFDSHINIESLQYIIADMHRDLLSRDNQITALTTKLTEQEAELARLRAKVDMMDEIEARYLVEINKLHDRLEARCRRWSAAMRTNEPQVISVVALTAMNAAALVSRDAYAPMWLVVGALLFWPLLAFLANLHKPIPPEVE